MKAKRNDERFVIDCVVPMLHITYAKAWRQMATSCGPAREERVVPTELGNDLHVSWWSLPCSRICAGTARPMLLSERGVAVGLKFVIHCVQPSLVSSNDFIGSGCITISRIFRQWYPVLGPPSNRRGAVAMTEMVGRGYG